MRIATMVMMAGALAACTVTTTHGEETNVHVDCETKATGIDCTVKQITGKTEVEACWDFKMTCANGGIVTADRTCQKVGGGGTAAVTIPMAQVHGIEGCGNAEGKTRTVKLEHMTVDGKAIAP